ncbi:RNA-binding protein [Schizosaccharomyces japonicus yFS275]|uniref:RNA-binding protein n=1 Tax=Schizosaccharomyces japonicus (strain yFS275 / FY16936) TaxID=402676 RepID=B6K4E2_SCHJY|nr:RNA-binding protein [Schizosaccharomyces japonicus yFS275]EEB08349.2 RNA-binding protein [Schizosaccharomyces japonicus yFS275]
METQMQTSIEEVQEQPNSFASVLHANEFVPLNMKTPVPTAYCFPCKNAYLSTLTPALYQPGTEYYYNQNYPLMSPYLPYYVPGNINNSTFDTEKLRDFRSLTISNLPNSYKISDLLSLIRTGPLEKACVKASKNRVLISFIHAADAFAFYEQCTVNRPVFQSKLLRVHFARPTILPESIHQALQQSAASRNVFIGNIPREFTEQTLEDCLSKYGAIENVKILSSRNIAFVHFLNIKSAIRVVRELSSDKEWHSRRVFYGMDHCSVPINNNSKLLAKKYNGYYAGLDCFGSQETGKDKFAGNRTAFLGNLHESTETYEICNAIHYGPLHDVHYIPEKHICFITFISPEVARSFVEEYTKGRLYIHGRLVKVGWGKESRPFPAVLQTAVSNGASRTVYVGHVGKEDELEKLLNEFSKYGEVEHFNYISKKKCVFISFTSLPNAIKAVSGVRQNKAFRKFRIHYGVDRCGGITEREYSTDFNSVVSTTSYQFGQMKTPSNISPPSGTSLHNGTVPSIYDAVPT